ncbi:MAG: hypothetical protein HYX32_01200 [Actinobacteria bacterium]|nr:hypothetical protein [Actinomycetota bacterium]
MTSPIADASPSAGVVLDVAVASAVGLVVGLVDDDRRLQQFATLIGLTTEAIERHGGERLQLRSDGLTACFELDSAHRAINSAIAVQERQKLANAARQPRLGIGLAAGPVRRLEPDGAPVGATVDRARWLAMMANDGAVLVDIDTVSSAPLHQIRSAAGAAGGRTALGYLSEPCWLPASPQAPIRYYEIVWDVTTRGLRPDALSSAARAADASSSITVPEPDVGSGWKLGWLRSWNSERQHGLIVADDGELFYVDDRFLAGDEVPPVGAEVRFRPRPSLIEGKNRVAAMVVTVGEGAGGSPEPPQARTGDHAQDTGALTYAGSTRGDGEE